MPDRSTVVYYATNRSALDDAFATASPADPRRLTLGRTTVQRLGNALKTEEGRHLLAPPDNSGNDDFADLATGGCARLLDDWLAAAADLAGVAVVFLHGFSNTFGTAIRRGAQLTEFYGGADLKLVPLVFSWPSDGRVIVEKSGLNFTGGAIAQYKADQADARASGPAIARLLVAIQHARARQSGGARATRLCLLAHSMGNLALATGLRELDNGLMTTAMLNLFDHAALVAADVSTDVFSAGRSMRRIAELARQVTVGTSYDNMLSVASEKANGVRRLGHSGPDDLSVLPKNVEVVDFYPGLDYGTKERVLPTVEGGGTEWDVIGHQWYRNDIRARADLALAMAGKPAAKRKKLQLSQQVDTFRARQFFLAQ
ncbi:alpha/beta hydrolase [Roseococcus sp. SYP-B2431]|uniref:alpha/beta hydrolase n=1 Tax=Roseococcus sp. SYP-B2431 TaxID=2496640 RepID=UPI00103F4354|nr:alpha/beta hydrolase [Roseococcus sp. SYP-B2431]TCH97930.1 alpha/beta hydrolase [Roseococcus sp. SYP-B2431]